MILLTGATGKVGRHVAAALGAQNTRVRAVSRAAKRAALPGVEAVQADLSNPDSLAPHLDGVDAAFLVWPFASIEAADDLAPRVVATLSERVPRIVYLSANAAEAAPDSFWARIERLVEASAESWTMLRPTGFAGNTLVWAGQTRIGDVVRWSYGDASRSLIDERDIAAVAVRALTEEKHAGKRYVLTGPERLTQIEQVQAIGRALGRDLRWEEVAPGNLRPHLASVFGSAEFADSALATWASFVDHPEPVTSTVRDVTGIPARPFEAWASDHAHAFR